MKIAKQSTVCNGSCCCRCCCRPISIHLIFISSSKKQKHPRFPVSHILIVLRLILFFFWRIAVLLFCVYVFVCLSVWDCIQTLMHSLIHAIVSQNRQHCHLTVPNDTAKSNRLPRFECDTLWLLFASLFLTPFSHSRAPFLHRATTTTNFKF